MTTQESKEAAKSTGMDPILIGSAASILLSWYYFYVRGEKQKGIFVGLWPPTLVGLSSYLREVRMEQMLEHGSADMLTKVRQLVQEQ